MCALILNSVAHLLPAVSIDELIFALYEREINSLLKAKASMEDMDCLLIITSESRLMEHPIHSEIELIPIEQFQLRGFSCIAE